MLINGTITPGFGVSGTILNNLTLNDNVKLLLGTLGADGELYSDGTDLFFNQLSGGGIMVGLAANPPSPDDVSLHLWKGSAGVEDAQSGSLLVLEHSDAIGIQLLGGKGSGKFINFGEEGATQRGKITYRGSTDTPADTMEFRIGNANRLFYSPGALAFQEATVLSTTTGNLTLSPSSRIVVTKILRMSDGIPFQLGTTGESAMVNRATSLGADGGISSIIEGTPNHQGVAANSWIQSNLTNDGDMMFLVSDGGDSKEFLKATGATAELSLGWGMAKIGFGPLAAITRPSGLTDVASVITALINLGLVTA